MDVWIIKEGTVTLFETFRTSQKTKAGTLQQRQSPLIVVVTWREEERVVNKHC